MKLKLLKKQISDKDFFLSLKSVFPNKHFRYFLFGYCKAFKIDDLDFIKKMYESLFLDQSKKNFTKTISKISTKVDSKYVDLNWESLAKFAYYVYNYSLYYFPKYKSIYTSENYVDLNIKKQKYFRDFLDSLYELKEKTFNKKIIDILKLSI